MSTYDMTHSMTYDIDCETDLVMVMRVILCHRAIEDRELSFDAHDRSNISALHISIQFNRFDLKKPKIDALEMW